MSLLKKQTVLIAMDGSKDSDWAFEWYTANMHRPGNQVYIVCCSQDSNNSKQLPVEDLDQADMSSLVEEDNNMMSESFVKYQNKLRSSLMVGRVFTSSNTPPGTKIVKTAKNHDVSMILLGAHGRRTGNEYVGSVCRYVLEHARVPVIVCRHPDNSDPKLSSSGSIGSDDNVSLDESSSPRSNEQTADGLSLSDVCSYWASVGSRSSDGQSRPSLSQLFLKGRNSLSRESSVLDDSVADNDVVGEAEDGARDGGEIHGFEGDGDERTKEEIVGGYDKVTDPEVNGDEETKDKRRKNGDNVAEDGTRERRGVTLPEVNGDERKNGGEVSKDNTDSQKEKYPEVTEKIIGVDGKEKNAKVVTDRNIIETKNKEEKDMATGSINEGKESVADGDGVMEETKTDDGQCDGNDDEAKKTVAMNEEEQEEKTVVIDIKVDFEDTSSGEEKLIGNNGEVEDGGVRSVEKKEIIVDGGEEIKDNEGVSG